MSNASRPFAMRIVVPHVIFRCHRPSEQGRMRVGRIRRILYAQYTHPASQQCVMAAGAFSARERLTTHLDGIDLPRTHRARESPAECAWQVLRPSPPRNGSPRACGAHTELGANHVDESNASDFARCNMPALQGCAGLPAACPKTLPRPPATHLGHPATETGASEG